jgi:hypothetical protein
LDLPTYTNIWRIEKRLYKLYDFRLPMPLPVGQMAVFAAIAVPYVVILKVAGLPFSHTLLWVYILPPGALAWVVTRPVLEGKRLPELAVSQLRYLSEPRTWCRMAPLAEHDEMVIVARVWHQASDAAAQPVPVASQPSPALAETPAQAVAPAPAQEPEARQAAAEPAVPVPSPGAAPPQWPTVTVTGDRAAETPLRVVERALGDPAERRTSGWHDRVVVVPGGHRPGRPDPMQRDQARVRLELRGRCRIVVLGCTTTAGQTTTALLTGEVLASLRDDPVAVLDLNQGPGSLAERARAVPPLTGSRPSAPSRLEVVTREAAIAGGRRDAAKIFELLAARYPMTLADPDAAAVPRLLDVADQLVLVVPASQDAASALAATREWLEAHGHGDLADRAITVLNGVSAHTVRHAARAEAVARGRCRAIVRIPWDDHLKKHNPERIAARFAGRLPAGQAPGPLRPATLHAYTALAGVLVAAHASEPERLRARS